MSLRFWTISLIVLGMALIAFPNAWPVLMPLAIVVGLVMIAPMS